MRSTFSILPYINRNKVKADGTTAVLCRITIDGKSSTMATGIYCRPEDWNSKGHLLPSGGLEQQDGNHSDSPREQPLAGVPQVH